MKNRVGQVEPMPKMDIKLYLENYAKAQKDRNRPINLLLQPPFYKVRKVKLAQENVEKYK